jgi:predicted DsbA family dithiol-disulfide isomerase
VGREGGIVSGGARPVRVFVYGDYACPFSYVADARLQRLAEEQDLEIRWRPYEIHAAVPSDGLPVREAGYPPDEWTDLSSRIRELAGELDLPVTIPDFIPNSHQALQVAEFARDVGQDAFERVHEALFRAYFVRGRNFGRRDVVLDVAQAAGLDREAVAMALEDGRYEEELGRASREAERYHVTGTPTFLFGRFKVVGAAPLPVLRDAALRARDDDPAPARSGGDDGRGDGEEERGSPS